MHKETTLTHTYAKVPLIHTHIHISIHKRECTHIHTQTYTSAYTKSPTYEPYTPTQHSFYGRTTRGITGLLLSIHYSVSYLSMAQAINAKLTYANIKNKAGFIVEPNTKTVIIILYRY